MNDGRLLVYMRETQVGQLVYKAHHNDMHFVYDEAYLNSPHAVALSFSLPLQKAPFGVDETTVFFENLLPPDEVRRRLGPILHLSRHNIFGFLQALGGDCAGAISLWAENAGPDYSRAQVKMLSEDESVKVMRALGKRPLFVEGVEGYRISGAGAQNKLIACIKEGRLGLPLFGAPSTHIIKPATKEYPDSVYNEFFAMSLAQTLKLKTAQCQLLQIGKEYYYVTERFDRETLNDTVVRLHQEDFCQICGVSGELKYENEGGPSIAKCWQAMQQMKLPLSDRLAFIDRIIFNFLIGNADAHAKNSSVLLYGQNKRRLAPIYDVMSTVIYKGLSRTNAMAIGGAWAFNEVTRGSFALMAQELDVRPDLVLNRLDKMLRQLPEKANALKSSLNDKNPSPVYERIVSVINAQCAALTV